MTGGVIIVRGDAGGHLGERMRRGLVAVQGSAGPYACAHMVAGTVAVGGTVGRAAGIGMKRGTLLVGGGFEPLPSFRYACLQRPGFLPLLLGTIGSHGLPVGAWTGEFRRYTGDATERGRGEILQCTKP
jgi:formylmethanofuran dehydrogenase subunit C